MERESAFCVRERESERGRLAPTNNNISEAGNGRQERAQVKG